MNWSKNLKGRIAAGVPLARLTSFKIGGNAQFVAHPFDVEDLRALLTIARRKKVPVRILGAGSNLLISDRGVSGIVVCLDTAEFKKIVLNGTLIECGAGVSLVSLVRLTAQHALSGFECLAGIPGSVGGSLVMNAGAWGGSIADRLVDVTVVSRTGCLMTIPKKRLRFGYRSSDLSRYVVIGARFALRRGNGKAIKSRLKKNLLLKKEQQDLSKPSAGCVFKNPPGNSAGKLIDQCGLKGARVGGAAVSLKHANYIINDRFASAADVVKLMGLVKHAVRKRFGIVLKPEIQLWD